MKVVLLRLLVVTKIQDGGSSKSRIATTEEFYWQSWATKALCYKKKKKPKKDNNLYDVEVTVVDKDKKCMKIHVGHGNEFDEWRDFKSTVISYHLSASKKLMFQTKKR